MRRAKQLSLLDMIDAATEPQTPVVSPGAAVVRGAFLAIFDRVPLTMEDALVLQIRRDRATIEDEECGAPPGRELYDQRIEACTARLAQLKDGSCS